MRIKLVHKLDCWFILGLICLVFISCGGVSPYYIAQPIYSSDSLPEPLNLENPSKTGKYKIKSFYYGSKINPRRPIYQESNIKVTTQSADISPYFTNIKDEYWGYDADNVPINGKVWYPDSEGDFPLVVCVHGNHNPYDFSEFGYDYIGKLLASRGIIFSSIDQNFLNSRAGSENDARAILLLEHAKQILSWDNKMNTPLYNIIDTENIAVIGHSRGGEAAVTAALFNKMSFYPENGNIRFDWNLPIKAVISLAPVEGQYRPGGRKISPTYVNYLLLHGSHDGDVDSTRGIRYFNRNLPDKDRFRSSFWIYGANHSQFNSTWAGKQDPQPTFKKNLITLEDQQKITKTLMSAFLDVSFNRNEKYKGIFKDYRKAYHWLPHTLYITQYQDSEGHRIADFEEDKNLYSTSYNDWKIKIDGFSRWYEYYLPLNDSNNQESWALFLKWYKNVASLHLYTKDNTLKGDELLLDLAFISYYLKEDKPLNCTIQIETKEGKIFETELINHYTLSPLPQVWIYNQTITHIMLQTISIDLNKIDLWDSDYEIKSIKFVFDKLKYCYIAIDNIIIK